MKKLFLLLLTVISFALCASAQTRTVRGSVVQDGDNEPLVGASVKAVGASASATTDLDGKFAIRVPSNVKEITVSFVGSKSKTVAISDEEMRITLEAENELDEVITVAYGTTKKESFTGSAEVVKGEKLSARPIANVTKALDGQVAGVQATSGSGQPGSGSSIVVRGFGSLSASTTPLYVVDGIPFDGAISAIAPSDIESLVVLKDASAGALYGARGANGVVMITTKKGNKEGKTKVDFKANWGVVSRSIPRYETLDEKGYLEMLFQHYKNNNINSNGMSREAAAIQALADIASPSVGVTGVDEQYNPFNYPIAELIDPTTGKVRDDAKLLYHEDWLDTAMRDNPLRQEYQIQLSGANDKTNWLFSLGYLDEQGLMKTTSFKRYSGRMNIDTRVNEWFKAGLNANYARTESNTSQTSTSANSNVWYSCQMMGPIFPVYQYNADGTPVLDNGKKVFDYGVNRPAGANSDWNTVATLYDDRYATDSDWMSARSYVTLGDLRSGALQGLKFTFNFGLDLANQKGMTYYNPYNGNAKADAGRLSKADARTFSYTTSQLLGYDRKFGLHHVDALVGHEFYKYNYQYLSGQKTNFAVGGLYELSAAATLADANSYHNDQRIESVLGRVNYDYADKYYLSASLRTDGTSRFYKDNRWGTFWSLGANWRISHESFMDDIRDKVNNLALRASYGVQGNESIGSLYAWQAYYTLGYTNGSYPGALVGSLENKELKWEKNANLNIGIDARLLNRVNVSIEWYNRKTKDMLLNYPMAISTGFSSYAANVGNMRNTGMDMTVRTEVIKAKDLNWNVTLMGSFVKNKVEKLTAESNELVGVMTIREGETINEFFVAQSAGVDPFTGEQLYWAYKPLQVPVYDDNGEKIGTADAYDRFGHLVPDESTRYRTSDMTEAQNWRKLSGHRIPDFYGSISSELIYRDFDFNALFTYSIGGKMIDSVYRSLMHGQYVGQAGSTHLARAWKEPGDITDVPRVEIGKSTIYTNDDLINASYFSIKSLSLGYTLPRQLLRKVGFEAIRFSVTGDNLFLFNHLKGMDNQYNFSGSTTFVYAPTRTVSFGVDVKF